MVDSFQNEVPAAHVSIRLDLHTGNTKKEIELPLKLLVVGDYSNGKEQHPLSKRGKVDINGNNFNNVMAEFSPAVSLTVEDTLNGNGNEQNIALGFKSPEDSEPEQVAKGIPQLHVLLAMRSSLRDLKSSLLDSVTFRRELENILKDPTLNSELRDGLAKVAPQESV